MSAADEAAARAVVERLAGELLSNPLIEAFEVEALGDATAEAAGRDGGGGRLTARIGIVLFPGSNRDIDAVNAVTLAGAEPVILWHESADLDGVAGVLLPGGFAYGDYLRAGVIARFSPVMRAVAAFADRGGPVLGICNGFQVLAEAGLVPGALLRNRALRFVCREVTLLPEHLDTPFTRELDGSPAADAGRARRGLLLRRRRGPGRAGARRPGAVALRERRRLGRRPRRRRQPQRLAARDRGRAQRRGQRGRPHAAPRDGRPRRSSAPTTAWASSARSS